jgi:hypothetical protein
MEPCLGHGPFASDHGGRKVECVSGFLDGQAAKESELNDLRLHLVELRERLQPFVESDNVDITSRRWKN